jgi:hypothetical protein
MSARAGVIAAPADSELRAAGSQASELPPPRRVLDYVWALVVVLCYLLSVRRQRRPRFGEVLICEERSLSGAAGSADRSGRSPDHRRARRNVFGNDRSGSHLGSSTDAHAAQDGRAGAD